jgi:hypothetical protein
MPPPLKLDHARLRALADGTASIAADLDEVTRSIGQPAEGPPGYAEFHRLWTAQLRTVTGAAHDLATALTTSADAYDAADYHAANSFGGA